MIYFLVAPKVIVTPHVVACSHFLIDDCVLQDNNDDDVVDDDDDDCGDVMWS